MVFVRERIINGKKRYYLEHSFRLPDNRVKKISFYIKDYDRSNEKHILPSYLKKFKEAEEKEIKEYYVNFYKKTYIFSKELISKLEDIRAGYAKLIKKLTKEQIKDILDRFTVNFTYESNAIEGNSLTLKDVTLIIYENISIKNKNLREIYETKNTRNAVDLIFKNKFKMNKKDIIKMHSVLIKNTGVAEGYKQLPNYLLMRKVKTAPPEKVDLEMNRLISWYDNTKEIHPLMKAAIFHGKFEQIHPFEDGNGRVGRMLINVILLSNGYPPLIIRKTQRVAYFNALEAFDNGHEDKFLRFLIEKYKDTYEKFFKVYVNYL